MFVSEVLVSKFSLWVLGDHNLSLLLALLHASSVSHLGVTNSSHSLHSLWLPPESWWPYPSSLRTDATALLGLWGPDHVFSVYL